MGTMALSFLPAAGASAKPFEKSAECRLSNLKVCRDINPLVHDKIFYNHISQFLRGGPIALVSDDRTLRERVFDNLGGPPDRVQITESGDRLFAACRYQSCAEKGAVFLGRDARVKGVAVTYAGRDGRALSAILVAGTGCKDLPVPLRQWLRTALGQNTSVPTRILFTHAKSRRVSRCDLAMP